MTHNAESVARCSVCGTDNEVRWVSPDMDIQPVPICVLCWYGGLLNDGLEAP